MVVSRQLQFFDFGGYSVSCRGILSLVHFCMRIGTSGGEPSKWGRCFAPYISALGALGIPFIYERMGRPTPLHPTRPLRKGECSNARFSFLARWLLAEPKSTLPERRPDG